MGDSFRKVGPIEATLHFIQHNSVKNKKAQIMSTTTTPDYTTIKSAQNAAWTAGDYSIVGTTLQIVGEQLCEALDLRAGQQVLDVAAGNGNVSLAAARRFANVVSTDYVADLLENGKVRAAAERLPLGW